MIRFRNDSSAVKPLPSGESFTAGSYRYIGVVGGGVAGLTAAAWLARTGRSVAVFEKSDGLGGRAATQIIQGFHFNLGPHALYRTGAGMRVLDDLGIRLNQDKTGTAGSMAVREGALHDLPQGVLSLLSSALFSFPARLEALRILARLPRIDTGGLERVTVASWLRTEMQHAAVRDFFAALIRLATYSNDPGLSAGAALRQLQLALDGGVIYLDHGWQTLVDRLRDAAVKAGAVIYPRSRVQAIEHEAGALTGLRLADGARVAVDAAILAVSPKEAAAILGEAADPKLKRSLAALTPVQLACLDLGLRRLPNPEVTFALGLDAPLYFSVHSRWGDLAPPGASLVHAAKYLPGADETDPVADRAELESYMDLVQPGWRPEVVHQRFLPRMTVTPAEVRAADGGRPGRPKTDACELPGVFLAGDWVGGEGLLADASFASARAAARRVEEARRPVLRAYAV